MECPSSIPIFLVGCSFSEEKCYLSRDKNGTQMNALTIGHSHIKRS